MMDEKEFWSMIAESRRRALAKGLKGDAVLDDQIDYLTKTLTALPPQTIIDFHDRFYDLHETAYGMKLWGAAYWLGGGCGNDGFTDFRATLISLGEERFKRIVKDPDSLAEIVDQPDVPFLQSEGFQYVAVKAYKAKVGKDIPVTGSSPAEEDDEDDDDEKWDFDDVDETREHLPKLIARFPEMGN